MSDPFIAIAEALKQFYQATVSDLNANRDYTRQVEVRCMPLSCAFVPCLRFHSWQADRESIVMRHTSASRVYKFPQLTCAFDAEHSPGLSWSHGSLSNGKVNACVGRRTYVEISRPGNTIRSNRCRAHKPPQPVIFTSSLA